MLTPTKGTLARFEDIEAGNGRIFEFQYNPGELQRRLEPMRNGPPRETITCAFILDASDGQSAIDLGPQIATLEMLMHPPSAREAGFWGRIFGSGAAPPVALVLFQWGKDRRVPVRVAQLSISEQLFHPDLTVIRAEVRVRMDVATSQDVADDESARNLLAAHYARREVLSSN